MLRLSTLILLPFVVADTSLLPGAGGVGPSVPAALTTLSITGSGAALSVSTGAVNLHDAQSLALASGDIVTVVDVRAQNVAIAQCPVGYGVIGGGCAQVAALDDTTTPNTNSLYVNCPAVCLDATQCDTSGACMISGTEQVNDVFSAGALSGTVQSVGWRCKVFLGSFSSATASCLRQ